MTQLQPDIMIVNSLHQNGSDPGAVTAQHIRIDLVTHQRSILRINTELPQALLNPLSKRLLGMGDAGNAVLFTEYLHTIALAVGYHANRNF